MKSVGWKEKREAQIFQGVGIDGYFQVGKIERFLLSNKFASEIEIFINYTG